MTFSLGMSVGAAGCVSGLTTGAAGAGINPFDMGITSDHGVGIFGVVSRPT